MKRFLGQEVGPNPAAELNRYLQILEDAKIISKCTRFDMKSRKSLQGEQKYYLADLGFYFALNTDNRINYGPVLENIVFLLREEPGLRGERGAHRQARV